MNKLKRNISISVVAQFVSIAVSLILNLFIPKVLDVCQFAHWQTYSLYASFVGIFHFGLLDGFLLRYAEYDEQMLDAPKTKSQFFMTLLLVSIASLFIACISFIPHFQDYKEEILMVSLAVLSKNVVTYFLYLFQSTNRIPRYVAMLLIQKTVFGIGILVLMKSGVRSFPYYCVMDIAGDVAAIFYGFFHNARIMTAPLIPCSLALKESSENISAGIFLLLSNWIAMMFVGMVRISVQFFWDLETFGTVSYAFSLANFFLSFVTAASVVIFPAMKRIDKDKLSSSYVKARRILGPFMLSALILYYPSCILLQYWLPQYERSYEYLGMMLPFIVFSSSVSLLSNNFMNAVRKERVMFKINIASMFLTAVICVLFAVVLHNLDFLLIAAVLPVVVRAVLSDRQVSFSTGFSFCGQIVFEILISISFILSSTLLPGLIGCATYAFCLLLMFFGLRIKNKHDKHLRMEWN